MDYTDILTESCIDWVGWLWKHPNGLCSLMHQCSIMGNLRKKWNTDLFWICNEVIKFGLHQSFVAFPQKNNIEVCFHRLRWKISRVIISGLVLRIFGCRKFLLYIFCFAIQFSAQPLTSNNAGKSLDVNIRLKDLCSLCPTCYLLIPNSVYFLYTL